MTSKNLSAALQAVPKTKKIIEENLRQMAKGQGEYKRFLYMSQHIKNILLAAAEIIAEQEKTFDDRG